MVRTLMVHRRVGLNRFELEFYFDVSRNTISDRSCHDVYLVKVLDNDFIRGTLLWPRIVPTI